MSILTVFLYGALGGIYGNILLRLYLWLYKKKGLDSRCGSSQQGYGGREQAILDVKAMVELELDRCEHEALFARLDAMLKEA